MRVIGLVALSAIALLSASSMSFAADTVVGVAAAVDQSAQGIAPTGATRTLSLGDKVIHNEQITTDAKGLLQILLADGTSFTVGPNSKMSIDSFVYDPDAGTAKVTATLTKGLFRFIGGKTSKSPDGVELNTPVGTVGIRGGIADIDLGGHSTGTHIDMRYGDTISLTENGQRVGWVFQNGYSIVIGANGQVGVQKTPPAWTSAAQAYLSSHSGQHGGAHTPPTGDTLVASKLGEDVGGPNGTGPNGTTAPNTNPDTVQLATWEEIYNSDLANVSASYSGTAVGTVTQGDGPAMAASGSLDVHYDFAERYGDLYINDFGGHDFSASVFPDKFTAGDPPQPTGVATFSGDLFEGVDCECSPVGDVNGVFTDQGGKIANGVIGSFNAAGDGYTAAGAFTGTYAQSR